MLVTNSLDYFSSSIMVTSPLSTLQKLYQICQRNQYDTRKNENCVNFKGYGQWTRWMNHFLTKNVRFKKKQDFSSKSSSDTFLASFAFFLSFDSPELITNFPNMLPVRLMLYSIKECQTSWRIISIHTLFEKNVIM